MTTEKLFELVKGSTSSLIHERLKASVKLYEAIPRPDLLREAIKLMTAAKAAKYADKNSIKEYYYTNARTACRIVIEEKLK